MKSVCPDSQLRATLGLHVRYGLNDLFDNFNL
nr:MAG TPA: hypothetical protein [Bacteriophage sp.]